MLLSTKVLQHHMSPYVTNYYSYVKITICYFKKWITIPQAEKALGVNLYQTKLLYIQDWFVYYFVGTITKYMWLLHIIWPYG